MDSTPMQTLRYARGFNFAKNHADVINCSWFTTNIHRQLLDEAIQNAITNGRDGLGCVVVFAVGNYYKTNPYATSITYPANSNNDIIAVGAISPDGKRLHWDGNKWVWIVESASKYGEELDMVAPGFKNITTQTGSAGGITYFSETSAAAPHVSAVAGLMLSVKPSLEQWMVAKFIGATAQKVGGYNYQITPGRPYGTWHEEVGYGLVNAHAAVLAAQNCNTYNLPPEDITSNLEVLDNCIVHIQNAVVKNQAKLTIEAELVTITGNFMVEADSELEIR